MVLPFPEASYTELHATGELAERVKKAAAHLQSCTVCPRACRVDRTLNEKGFCKTGVLAQVASSGPHFGEEPELVGRNGSGTIFFAHCNLACEFCQNYAISQCSDGQESDASALAAKMLMLERQGCHNINLVTPSHVVPQILAAIDIAAGKGLTVPLVYNSGGYDSVETLRLLDGVVDIYMPDAKYGDNTIASALSHAPDYVDVMKAALKEMHRQVGDLVVQKRIAVSGMIIRHLVLPGDLAGTRDVLQFIAEEISRDSYVNVMAQYRPLWHAPELARSDRRFRALGRPLQQEDYNRAIRYGKEAGLTWVNAHHH